MADATPDYRKTHFETSTLTKCEGEPTFDVILNWHNILKANAAKVHTGLFGGNHGYLALLLSAAAYALISPANNVRPIHPGALLIPANTTQHMAMTMKDAHKEALRVFRECQGVEAAFQQMLVEACEPIYLEALRDATTNAINLPIYTIIQYLYDTYGAITPEMLKEKRIELENMQFDSNLPIDVIFNKIEKFTHISEAAGLHSHKNSRSISLITFFELRLSSRSTSSTGTRNRH